MFNLTVDIPAYVLVQESGKSYAGSVQNLTFEFDDAKENIKMTDHAFRNWAVLMDSVASNISINGSIMTYAEAKSYLLSVTSVGYKEEYLTMDEYIASDKNPNYKYYVIEG